MSAGQGWSQQQGPGGAGPGGQPADLLTRFLGRLIDGILIGIVTALIVVSILFGGILDVDTGSAFAGSATFGGILANIVSAAIVIGYYAFMESTRGQTVGKMVMKTKVVGPDGGNPTLETSIKRNLWQALTIVPIVGGLLQLLVVIYIAVTINGRKDGSGWHDEFAGGTRVLKV